MHTTRAKRYLTKEEFTRLVRGKKVEISSHALFRLGEGQRKVFKLDHLIETLTKEAPLRSYLQENGRYAAYFRKSKTYLKLILDINKNVVIVTFMTMKDLPRT